MLRVAVTGAAGRMGKTLIQALTESDDLQLGAAFERTDSSALGADAGELAGVGPLNIPVTLFEQADPADFEVVIDFTAPQATLTLAEFCCREGKAMVIGTTGFTESELEQLELSAAHVPLFMSPNMSVGVNLTFKLIEMAARALGDDVDVEVIEAHHRHKVDAPSGTAVHMGKVLAEALDRNLEEDAIYGRQGITGARERNTIGFSTVRGGDIVGEHTVMFIGDGERLEITHRASSRMNFALGALRAVRHIRDKAPGKYNMQTLLDI
jgi:4-hydroxy-tetrahydrodipicolinate reductase